MSDHAIQVVFVSNLVPVTVQTDPPGILYATGMEAYTAPHTFSWAFGSWHSILTAPYIIDNTRYVCSGWSNGETLFGNYYVTGSDTLTISYQAQYQLTLSAPGGSGGISGAVSGEYYTAGSALTLAAPGIYVDESGTWGFTGWSGDASGADNPLLVTMDASKSITANYDLFTSLTVDSGEHGSVSPEPGTYYYPSNTVVDLIAVPDDGYGFEWTQNVDSPDSSHTSITVSGQVTVSVSFPPDEYTLTTPNDGSGSVDRSSEGPYYLNDVVEITAVPGKGWTFSQWIGDASGSANPLNIRMDGDKEITATFIINSYTVTFDLGEHGLLTSG